MSAFVEKIRNGVVPTELDWEKHLIEVHDRQPRLTPEAFAGFATEEGANSYAILAGQLSLPPQDLTVVDLGCGDGHLIPYMLSRLGPKASLLGLDISATGIEIARAQILDPRVHFAIARAQEIPLNDRSVDHVFSHLALMLMTPLEPVIHEVRRILQPGGWFSFVVGGGTAIGLYREIRRVVSLFVQAHLPRFAEARVGSVNLGHREGLEALFSCGFEAVEDIYEFQLRYHVPPEGIWIYLQSMYFIAMLPEPVQRELQDELMALARDHKDCSGKVLFYVPMKCISVKSGRP